MAKICKKCGYERHISDKSPEYECPKCGAIYAKVDAFLEKEKVEPKKSNFCNQCGIDISKQTNSSHKCNKEEKDKAKASGTVLIAAIVLVFLFIWPNYQSILEEIKNSEEGIDIPINVFGVLLVQHDSVEVGKVQIVKNEHLNS